MPNILRCATPNEDWRSFRFINTYESPSMRGAKDAFAAGYSWLYQVQDTVGALLETALFGDEGVLIYHAEKIIVPKKTGSGEVFLPGDRVYWDQGGDAFVTPRVGPGYWWIGIATEPAGVNDTLVEIDLCGNKTEVEGSL